MVSSKHSKLALLPWFHLYSDCSVSFVVNDLDIMKDTTVTRQGHLVPINSSEYAKATLLP